MTLEYLIEYCTAKRGVTTDFPFDANTLVVRVMGKIFLIADVEEFVSFNVKCDPELASEWREKFNGVLPGYHMNKKHWNTVESRSDVPDTWMIKMIDHSYELVVAGLTKKQKEQLEQL